MSIESMSHVLNLNVGDSTRKLVLLGFANHASKDGTAAFPPLEMIVEYANCSRRTVQRAVAQLVADGFMREGDQRFVAHKPRDKRQVVYDVAMTEDDRAAWKISNATATGVRAGHSERGSKGLTPRVDANASNMEGVSSPSERGDNLTPRPGDNLTPREEGSEVSPMTPRGVTPVTERGDTGVTLTVLQPSLEPSLTTFVPADAATADDEPQLELISEIAPTTPVPTFADFWSTYPRTKTGKADAERAWAVAIRRTDPRIIMEGVRRFAADPNLPSKAEETFIKHAATWLRKGCWEDGPLPPRISGRGKAYNDAETWGTEPERVAAAEAKKAAWESMSEQEQQAELDRIFGDDGAAAAHSG